MKKIVVSFLMVSLLTGCSQIDSLIENTPFAKKSEEIKEVSPEKTKIADLDLVSEGPVLEAVYFNEVKAVDGKQVIQNPENILVMVNKLFSLPSEYSPSDLIKPNVPFSFGNQEIEKSLMREEAAAALESMFVAATENDIELFAVSGYRSYSRQEQIFQTELQGAGEEKAEEAVAVPGNSEHQSGLAMDISARSVNLDLIEQFGETKEGQWLEANAHKFGFILRYPKGKEGITGYMYEPWHFRYVGIKAATEIYKNNWTLEEYFEQVKKI